MDSIKIGSRGSALALCQAEFVSAALRDVYPDLVCEIVPITTSGDWKPCHGESPLPESSGGKGLFVKEIEDALIAGKIDCAVHSMKDVPSVLPDGLCVEILLPREDPRDALLVAGGVQGEQKAGSCFAALPEGARIGTTSPRRRAQILSLRPDVHIVPLRGNVPTRLEKLRAGQVDAAVLAVAGLNRLGLAAEIAEIFDMGILLPACGQGAIGIETRKEDSGMLAFLRPVHCHSTGLAVAAERAALRTLGGSCHTPIGAHAAFSMNEIFLRVLLAEPDGSWIVYEEERALITDIKEAEALGRRLGKIIAGRAPVL